MDNAVIPLFVVAFAGYVYYVARMDKSDQEAHLFKVWIGLALMGVASLVLTAIFPELRGSGGG